MGASAVAAYCRLLQQQTQVGSQLQPCRLIKNEVSVTSNVAK